MHCVILTFFMPFIACENAPLVKEDLITKQKSDVGTGTSQSEEHITFSKFETNTTLLDENFSAHNKLAVLGNKIGSIEMLNDIFNTELGSAVKYEMIILLVHNAVKTGDSALLQELLHRGIDANVPDRNGNTPLQLATCNNQNFTEIFHELLKFGGDVNIVNQQGYNMLFHAIENNRSLNEIMLIVNKGGNWQIRDIWGENVLHKSVEFGRDQLLWYWLTKRNDSEFINCKNIMGDAPIHHLLHTNINSEKIMRLLHRFNADVNVINTDKKCIYELLSESYSAEKLILFRQVFVNRVYYTCPICLKSSSTCYC